MFAPSAHRISIVPSSLTTTTPATPDSIAPFPMFSYTPHSSMPRIVSNKENTFTVQSEPATHFESHSKTEAATKPRVKGMGRPKPATGRHHSASYKPASRTASIKRAKLKANKTRLGRRRATEEADDSISEDIKMECVSKETPTVVRRKVLCLPFHAIPLGMHRPLIPPVTHTNEDGTKIPVDYVLKCLLPLLPSIYEVCNSFRPAVQLFGSVQARQDPPMYPFGLRLDDAFEAVPYWVSEAIHHGGLNPAGQSRCRARGPNAVLLVRKIGQVATEGTAYPIHKIAFTTRCSQFAALVAEGRSMRSPWSNTSSTSLETISQLQATKMRVSPSSPARARYATTIPRSSARSALPPSPPTAPTRAEERGDQEEDEHPLYCYSRRFEGADIPRPEENANVAYGVKNLPIFPVYLPDPSTFDLILRHLHFPAQSLLSLFFSTDANQISSQIIELRKSLLTWPADELLRTAHKLQGFYNNAMALGISSSVTWNQWALAQALIREVIRARGAWIDPTQTYMLVPKQHGKGLPPLVMVPCQEPTIVRVKEEVLV